MCRRPPSTLHSPLRRRAGGAGHPLCLGDARWWGGSAFPPRQLSPTNRGPPGATVCGRFCTAQHWGHFESWMSSSTVAFLFLPRFDSECSSASLSLYVFLSLTQFLFLSPQSLCVFLFLFHSFSLSFLGCLCVPVILCPFRWSCSIFPISAFRCLFRSPSFISPASSSRTLAPRSRGALARGARPGPSSVHIQVQRLFCWEPEGTQGWMQLALVWALGSRG